MASKRRNVPEIEPEDQRTIAKSGRMASGAGKTIRSTRNSKEMREGGRHAG